MKRLIAVALLALAVWLVGCNVAEEEQASSEEPASPKVTAGEPCSKGPPQSVGPLTGDDKARTEAEMAARSDEDWSMCYAIFNGPGQDGSVIPVAETAAKLQQAQQEAKNQMPGALNAAGNPANDSPESATNAERNKCLEDTYKGMSIAEKGERSRQVKAEAEAQGVSVFDVVGC